MGTSPAQAVKARKIKLNKNGVTNQTARLVKRRMSPPFWIIVDSWRALLILLAGTVGI
jgi:hypothetical protein